MKTKKAAKARQLITKTHGSKRSKLPAHQKSGPISADMTIAEAVNKFPKAIPVLMKYGMHCIGCPMSMQEKIGEGAEAHGIDVKKLLDELNKTAK